MDSAAERTPRRLLRVLIASGILALGWVAVDMVTHSEPAAAAETIDLLPVGDDSIGDDAIDLVTTVVGNVVAETVAPVTAPVMTTVVAPVVAPVSPLVDAVVAPIGTAVHPITDAVVDPLVPAIATVIDPITPILTTVMEPVAPVLAVLPTVDIVTDIAQQLPAFAPNGTILAAGGAILVSSALVAIVVPLLPVPTNGGPIGSPLSPAAPGGGVTLIALYGELNSGLLAPFGASSAATGLGDDLPSSPTFDSDTTPD